MEIKTKINLGQKVYLLWNNKVICPQIDGISVRVIALGNGEKDISITYELVGLDKRFDEEVLFATKEELLQSL